MISTKTTHKFIFHIFVVSWFVLALPVQRTRVGTQILTAIWTMENIWMSTASHATRTETLHPWMPSQFTTPMSILQHASHCLCNHVLQGYGAMVTMAALSVTSANPNEGVAVVIINATACLLFSFTFWHLWQKLKTVVFLARPEMTRCSSAWTNVLIKIKPNEKMEANFKI
jgi:hypothetical protein